MASRHFSMKSGKAGAGRAHAEYIEGGGKYAERDDVRYIADRNMPTWAEDGRVFFGAADKLERANGRAYTEIEAAIPRAVADPVAYAIDYAENVIGQNHPYRLAVHDKLASDGGRNIHLHLMFSDRKLDGIERPQEQFFKRASSRYKHAKTGKMMEADPAKGGAIKDRKWNERATVQLLREHYSAHAKTYGIELDLRSNQEQGLGRAEKKIGPAHPRAELDPRREQRQADVQRIRQVRGELHQVKAELDQVQAEIAKEQQDERQQQHNNARNRQRNRGGAEFAQVQDLQQLDDIQSLAVRSEMLLQRDEPYHLAQREAQPDTRRVHELDANRAIADAALLLAHVKRQTWRGHLNVRRQQWANTSISLTSTPGKSGKPTVHRWGTGNAKGYAAVMDYGDRLKPAGNPAKVSDGKIAALLQVAEQKGWKEICIKGDADFRKRVVEAAVARGLGVIDADLKPYANFLEKRRQQAADAAVQARFHAETLAKAKVDQERVKARAEKPVEPARTVASPALPTSKPLAQEAPAPTIEALKKEKDDLLMQGIELSTKSDVIEQAVRESERPKPFNLNAEWERAADSAAAELNAEVLRRGLPKAMPANKYEYDHQAGWGRERDLAKQALIDHDKSGRPLPMLGRGAWDKERERIDANVKQWEQRIEKRNADHRVLAEKKFLQRKAEHAKAEAEAEAEAERQARHEAALKERALHQERMATRENRLHEIDRLLSEKDRSLSKSQKRSYPKLGKGDFGF